MNKIEKEYIRKIGNEIEMNNFLKKINNIYLRDSEINILKKYNINYEKCTSLNELIYLIEDILNYEDYNDLCELSKELSERNYYQNTNK